MAGSFDCVDVEEQRIALVVSETRKHCCPSPVALGWEGKMPQAFQWRSRLVWAAKVSAFPWTRRVTTPVARAVLERVLGILGVAFQIGSQAKSAERLSALVRLESLPPTPPGRTAAKGRVRAVSDHVSGRERSAWHCPYQLGPALGACPSSRVRSKIEEWFSLRPSRCLPSVVLRSATGAI